MYFSVCVVIDIFGRDSSIDLSLLSLITTFADGLGFIPSYTYICASPAFPLPHCILYKVFSSSWAYVEVYNCSGRMRRIFAVASSGLLAFLTPSWCCGNSPGMRSPLDLIRCLWLNLRRGSRCLISSTLALERLNLEDLGARGLLGCWAHPKICVLSQCLLIHSRIGEVQVR